MSKYINTLFAFMFVALFFSCSNRTISDFEVPAVQEQQSVNNNSNLDQFVDDVKPFEETPAAQTEAQKADFYNDDSTSKAQK